MVARASGAAERVLVTTGVACVSACAAIALYGMVSARLALHAAYDLKRRGSGRAAVSLCGGGGQGEALLLSR